MNLRRLAAVALVLAAALVGAGNAQAGFKWSMDDNAGNSIELTDGSGVINFNGNVGAYSVVGTAQSKPSVGSDTLSVMRFSSLSITTTGAVAAPLTLRLTDTDFPATSARMDKVSWIGSITQGSVTGDGYFDPANTEYGTGGLHLPFGTETATTTPKLFQYDSGFVAFPPGSVPFSMFMNLEIAATGPLNLTFSEFQAVQQMPEPGTAVLAAIGGLVWGVRRVVRQRRQRSGR